MKRKKKKLKSKDKNLLKWLKKGGRKEAKKDFVSLLKQVAQPKGS